MPRLGVRLGWRESRTPGSETTRFHVFHVVARACVHAAQHQRPSGSDQAVYVEGVILIRLARDRQPAANRCYCRNFLGRRSLGARQREARRECSRRKCHPGARFHQRLWRFLSPFLANDYACRRARKCAASLPLIVRGCHILRFCSYREAEVRRQALLTKRRSNATLDQSRRRGIILSIMAIEVKIPAVGESITSGVVSVWHKKSGEFVNEGEPLFTLETDKVSTEIVAEKGGLLETKVPEGQEVKIGEVVATIDDSKQPGEKKVPEPKKAEKPREKKEERSEVKKKEPEPEKKVVAQKEKAAPQRDKPLSPAVLRIVEEEQLEPEKIHGTGMGGRLTKGR